MMSSEVKDGVARIAAERERQKSVEGWTPEHDAEHDDGAMAAAASCYAWVAALSDIRRNSNAGQRVPDEWPWDAEWWKPKDRIRDLERAGALIAAEIDRLLAKESA